MSYADVVEADRKLLILRLLSEAAGYRLNSSVLATALGEWGHRVSADQARTYIAWLAEQGLITAETVSDRVLVATITDRGLDVASGAALVPGVARPRPGL